MSKTQRTGGTSGVGDAGYSWDFPPDRPERSQPIVIRAWPSSWSKGKWILEAYAAQDCEMELAVLPVSSPCGSAEADDLTRLALSERAARLFSTGKRVFRGTLVEQTLRDRLRHESYLTAFAELTSTLRGLKESSEQETALKIEQWKHRLASLQ